MDVKKEGMMTVIRFVSVDVSECMRSFVIRLGSSRGLSSCVGRIALDRLM